MSVETKVVATREIVQKLKSLNVSEEVLDKYSVICLPENLLEGTAGDLLEGEHALMLAKLLKELKQVSVAHSFDLGLDIPRIDRRSDHKWFGVIWIREHLAVPFVISVLSSLCVVGLTSDNRQPSPPTTVHAEVYLEKGDDVKYIRYSGDPATLLKLMDELSNDAQPDR